MNLDKKKKRLRARWPGRVGGEVNPSTVKGKVKGPRSLLMELATDSHLHALRPKDPGG